MKDLSLQIRALLKQGMSTEAIVKQLGCDPKAVYRQRHLLKKADKKKGKVRAYVRRVPKHPDQTQIVEAYERGVRTKEKESTDKDFVIQSLGNRLDDAIAKNYELVEEIRRLDTVIQYLETKIARLMK